MAVLHPQLKPLRDLRSFLSVISLFKLSFGRARNCSVLWPFQAQTSRTQPSNSKFIFGPDVCFRFLILPPPGWGLRYLDYKSQEFGVAAVLSGDQAMIKSCMTGDPHMDLAKVSGAAPENATKKTHGPIRELYKTCNFGTLYGQGIWGLARQIKGTPIEARELQDHHRKQYREYWAWIEKTLNLATYTQQMQTTFGWLLKIGENYNLRAMQNWSVQSNAGDMLRIAINLAVRAGVGVCAPVHDAVLIVAPLDRLDRYTDIMNECMQEASRLVLNGFTLGVEVEIEAKCPNRYVDERGVNMWAIVMGALAKAERNKLGVHLWTKVRKCLTNSASTNAIGHAS